MGFGVGGSLCYVLAGMFLLDVGCRDTFIRNICTEYMVRQCLGGLKLENAIGLFLVGMLFGGPGRLCPLVP